MTKYHYDAGPALKDFPNKFTFRAAWGDNHAGVPHGMVAFQVKKESTGESKFLLTSRENFEKFGWVEVIDPAKYEEAIMFSIK